MTGGGSVHISVPASVSNLFGLTVHQRVFASRVLPSRTVSTGMKILVTGTDGYIGSLLVPTLVERGHTVTGLDTGFYRDGWLYDDGAARPMADKLQKDVRAVSAEDLKGVEAVVHLAELSNDPLGQHDEENTYAINHRASVRLAELCKEQGIERFVYTSSCSVYGAQYADVLKTETDSINPQTAYAHCKALVERDVSALADEAFSPTFLRNATAYGPSPRMRFDIVLNNLAGLAWTMGELRLTSDGTPWRPLVHVQDICRAIACTLEAPRPAVHNEIFNVGATDENYQVREMAEFIDEVLPGCPVSTGHSDGDSRSYRVSFEKIQSQLPGFQCEHTAREGAEELIRLFDRISLSRETFEFRAFTRLDQLEHLIDTGQIDDQFFWKQSSYA